MRAVLLFLLAVLSFAPASRAAGGAEYVLSPDDEIRLTVFGEDSLNGVYKIGAGGAVSLPLIGEIRLAGLTASGAQSLIRDKFADGYLVDPGIAVEIAKYRPFYILGEVRSPGRYDYAADMRVLNAVALAGGFTYRANQKNMRILRAGESAAREFPSDAPVAPGDVITVGERFF